MSAMVSQITSLTIIYSTVYSGADQRKHQSSASLAIVWGIHRWPVNAAHKGPVKPRSHMYCNQSATALRRKNSCNQCNHCAIKNCRSIGDWSATTIPKNRRPVGDRSATGGRLIANWLEIGCDWSATGWRLVGHRSAMGWRLTIEQTICCVVVIMNKALIHFYSMAISISIMSYCLFLGYFLVRIYIYIYIKTVYFKRDSL